MSESLFDGRHRACTATRPRCSKSEVWPLRHRFFLHAKTVRYCVRELRLLWDRAATVGNSTEAASAADSKEGLV
jgi:hypothetical protein